MQAHQQRVVDENVELSVKIVALGKFIASEKFMSLHVEECRRLVDQIKVMCLYSDILTSRIRVFKP